MRLIELSRIEADTGVDAETFVVGDLHAEDGSRVDRFAPNATLFYNFAQAVGWENIVYGGDTFELWQASARSIQDAYPGLWEHVRRGVRGNHDDAFTRLPRGTLRLGNVLIAHGHQADPWNSRYKLVGRLVTRVSGWLEWLFVPTPGREGWTYRLGYIERYMEPWRWNMLGEHHHVAALLHGHDHVPDAFTMEDDDRVVADWGTWAEAANECHAVRIRHNDITLFRVAA